KARHEALPCFFLDQPQIILTERMQLIGRVAKLNCKRVLIETDAANFATVLRDNNSDNEIFIETATRYGLEAARKRSTGIDDRLSQIRGGSPRADLRKFRAKTAAFAFNDVARSAARSVVNGSAAIRIAGNCGRIYTSERSHIGHELPQLVS